MDSKNLRIMLEVSLMVGVSRAAVFFLKLFKMPYGAV